MKKHLSLVLSIFFIAVLLFTGCEKDKPDNTEMPNPTTESAGYEEGVKYFEDGYYFEVIENSVKIVGHQDNGEKEIVVPEEIAGMKVKILGSDAFYQHKAVESIVLPDNLTAIIGSPFYRCYSLKKIFIPENVSLITSNPFFRASSLSEITVDSKNIYYSSEDGVLYDRAKTKLIAYPEGKPDESYTMPETVKTISIDSFGYHAKVKTIKMPVYLTSFPSNNIFVFPDDYKLIVHPNTIPEAYAEQHGIKYELVEK